MFFKELREFFHKFFINGEYDDTKKDDIIRLYVSLFFVYIEENKFNETLLKTWSNEIKPYLLQKYPITKEENFNKNSDLVFLIQSLEKQIKKYNKEIREKSKIRILKKEFNKNQEIKRNNSMINLTYNSKEINNETHLNDTNLLEDENLNINQLIENSHNGKNDEKDGGFLEILRRNKTNVSEKDMDQINIKTRNKRSQTIINIKEMLPRYKEVKEENNINIFYKEPNNNISSISVDLMLKKIIFEDFMNKNELLIYHFCQQCFCFVNKDTFFKKLFDCYKFYKNNISLANLKNLIDFINVIIIEMFDYYKIFDFNESHIKLIKKFYYCLINDLIQDVIKDEKHKERNNKNEKDLINENYDINDICKIFLIEKKKNNFLVNKKDLINDNLNIELNRLKIITPKNLNNINTKVVNTEEKKHFKRLSLKLHKLADIFKNSSLFVSNKQNNLSLLSPEEKEEQTLKYLKKSIIIKNPNIISEEQNDKNNEKKKSNDSDSDADIYDNYEEKNNIINEKNNENKNIIIKNIFDDVFSSEKFLTIKEEIIFNLQYILSLINCKNEKNEIYKAIKEAELNTKFYDRINNAQKQKNEIFTFHSLSSIKLPEIPNKTNKPIRENLSKGYFCVTDYSVEEIGDKLLQISQSLINKIDRKELYRGIYLKKDKEKQSPNVCKCINNFNKLTHFIIEDVLSYNYPKDRAKIYSRWIEISDYCKSKRDYNDCVAIYSALNSYIFSKLNLTFKEIKTRTKNIFIEVSKFCKCEENYKKIREEMNICEKEGLIFTPYLGMLLRDINFFEQTSNYITDNGCLNLETIENVNKIMEKYFRFKSIKKRQNENESIGFLDFLENLEYVPEENLEEMAKNIEPLNLYKSSGLKRPTSIDKKYFEKYKKRGTIQPKLFYFPSLRSQSFDIINC